MACVSPPRVGFSAEATHTPLFHRPVVPICPLPHFCHGLIPVMPGMSELHEESGSQPSGPKEAESQWWDSSFSGRRREVEEEVEEEEARRQHAAASPCFPSSSSGLFWAPWRSWSWLMSWKHHFPLSPQGASPPAPPQLPLTEPIQRR